MGLLHCLYLSWRSFWEKRSQRKLALVLAPTTVEKSEWMRRHKIYLDLKKEWQTAHFVSRFGERRFPGSIEVDVEKLRDAMDAYAASLDEYGEKIGYHYRVRK